MAAISPFTINPLAPPDRATAYWRAVCCQAGYQDDNSTLQSLLTLAGAVSFQQLAFPAPLPNRAFVAQFPGSTWMVLVNGTTQFQQIILQAMGALLAVMSPWPGRISFFDAYSALTIRSILAQVILPNNPQQIVYVGHSLGGAVATLLAAATPSPILAGCWTCGQPRIGDATFAASLTFPYERYTTVGDPVPVVPPSNQPLVGQTFTVPWPFPTLSYEHGGLRRQVWPDGTIEDLGELPTWLEGSAGMMLAIAQGTGWYGAHSAKTYACRIRAGIPVPWRTADPAWPLLDQVDTLYAGLLADTGGVCSDEVNTFGAARNLPPREYAIQGICT